MLQIGASVNPLVPPGEEHICVVAVEPVDPLLSLTKFFKNRSAEVNSPTDPSTNPLLSLM